MNEIWRLSAIEVASRIRARGLSAREVAEAALARLDAVNPKINAVIAHRPEEVLAEADAVDSRIGRGEDPGPLAGVPVTIKVNVDQQGFATTNGLALQKDVVAAIDSPVVHSLRAAGAVILGRTNTPAFSLRWFTTNLLHGDTLNPRDRTATPGGSSGGAAAAVAAGIGHLAHGTDIGGSIRYPAYACGVHGLRPSLGRVAAYNASSPERSIGPQIMGVSGPIGRTVADLRVGLQVMAAPDPRDPWYVPVPFDGPPVPRRATLCVRPNGLAVAPEIEAALRDAADRLRSAGWAVDEVDDVPSLREATALQVRLWLGDGFPGFADAVAREGDPGAMAVVAAWREEAEALAPDVVAQTLTRRATLTREWLVYLADHPVLMLPVSAELPFDAGADLGGTDAFRRIWEANLVQTGLPLMGLPGLTVSTGLVGQRSVGIQLIGQRYREDLLLLAGEAIEAGGVPASPIDPAW